jgi:DNA invertase Pin-like site-specific DNA recombinase
VFAIFAGLAEFERELICERVNAGLAAAREEGRTGGRPKLEDARVHELHGRLARGQSWRTIAREMGISQATISWYAPKREPSEAQAS